MFYPLIMSKFGTVSFASAYTGILGFFPFWMRQSGHRCIYVSTYRKPGNCSEYLHVCISVCFLYDERNFFILFTDIHVNSSCIRTSDRGCCDYHLYHDKNILISAVIGAAGEIALVIVYVVKSSIFQGGIQKGAECIQSGADIMTTLQTGVFDDRNCLFYFCCCDLPVPYYAVHSERDAMELGGEWKVKFSDKFKEK